MARADITALDATAQLAALASLRLSAVDLLRVSLARRADVADLGVMAGEAVDAALERAKSIDDHRALGDSLGPLAGLPLTIGEGLDIEHIRSSRFPQRKAADAAAVARLRRAGAVIWAASKTDARNPWSPDFPTRGAHAAVAVGLTPLDLAVDRAGGLIREASHTGVFAHRPSRGLVRQRGADPPGFDKMAELDLVGLGPVARSARDLRLALSVLAEASIAQQAPPLELRGLKLALWLKEPQFRLDPAVKAVIESAAAELTAAGALVQVISSPVDADQLRQTLAKLDQGARGRLMTHKAWLAADEVRAHLAHQTAKVFEGFEAILAPAVDAALGATLQKFRRPLDPWPMLAVTLGLPVSVIPAGFTAHGAPVGLQVIGRANGDSRVLSLAESLDRLLGGYRPPPLDI